MQRLKDLVRYQSGGFTPEKVQKIIDRYGHGKSPFTASDYIEVSNSIGVPIDLLLAQGIAESNLGTQGRAVRTKNVGNVGNTSEGGESYQKTWLDGLYRQAKLLKKEYEVNNQADVQRLLNTDFTRPKLGSKYTDDVGYSSFVGGLLNKINGSKIYSYGNVKGNEKLLQQFGNVNHMNNYLNDSNKYTSIDINPINYSDLNTTPKFNLPQVDFKSLSPELQKTYSENVYLQNELLKQDEENKKTEYLNNQLENDLKQKEEEKRMLLSNIPKLATVDYNTNKKIHYNE